MQASSTGLWHAQEAIDLLICHADIQEGNIMFSIEDEAELKGIEEDEISKPSARKVYEDGATFLTRQVYTEIGNPKLIDLGEARFGQDTYTEQVMPDLYRAPEVLLGLPWDEKIDIWALGLTVSRTLQLNEDATLRLITFPT